MTGVVVTSRAQNPTGAVVSPARARVLRRLLRRYPNMLVIEDDHAAELSHDEAHPLVGSTRSWAYVRSVSKPYGPDLRVAVMAGDSATVARIEGRMRLGVGWVSTLLQRLVVELWRDPAVTATVARAKDLYARRRTALRDALGDLDSFGDSGINVWIPVPDETAAVAGLRSDGIAVAPGALYRLNSEPAIRVTTAALQVRQAEGVAAAIRRRTTVTAGGRWA